MSLTRRAVRAGGVAALTAVGGLVFSVVVGSQAAFGGDNAFPQAYNPETAVGFTNTFTPPTETLNPDCPNGIAGTPGSDPAHLAINGAIGDNFSPGGTVHFVYSDDAHDAAFNFTIQICAVVYPQGFFAPSDFDHSGVLTNTSFSKHDLDSNGTVIDGAALTGISDPDGSIYFSWTSPTTVPDGSWICSFARDDSSNHGGGGNRKVTPTCYQAVSNIQI